ncbi:phage tail tape measure protein [Streptomyces sp. NPDC006872]|uniref:phage tail tape measure protein n=1 Tax=Streptomyces sp. NPDC006872 TaxID=3155720 RepID=UPI0033CD376C
MGGDSRTLRVVIVGNADSAQDAIDGLADSSANAGDSVGAMGGKFEGLKAGLAGMGAAILAALPLAALAGFSKGLDEIGNRAKLAAQMGLSGEDAGRAGKLAGDLYVGGFGESTAEAGEIVKRVSQDLNMSVNSVDFKPVANKVAALAETFDLEVGGITNAVTQMLTNGLAKNADEAFDVITKSMQNGANKADDLLDTINEYSPQFAKMGLSGQQAIGMITQAIKGGARDSDNVADAIKEFTLRAVDGSETTSTAFKRLGIDADDFTKKFTKGGAEGQAALDQVFDKLRTLKGAEWQTTVTDLFGGAGEDLGVAINKIDPSKAVAALGKVKGAANDMADTMNNNASAKVESFKRKMEMGFTNAFATVITKGQQLSDRFSSIFGGIGNALEPAIAPVREGIQGLVDMAGPLLSDFSGFFRGTLVPLFKDLWATWQPVLVQLGTTLGSYFAYVKAIFTAFVTVVKFLWGIFGGFLLDTVKNVFGGIAQFVSGVFQTIQGVFQIFKGLFTGNWSLMWSGIKNVFGGIWNAIVGAFRVYIYGSIVGILRGGVLRLLTLWKSGLTGIRTFFVGIWNGIRAFFTGKVRQLTVAASNGAAGIRKFFVTHFQSLVSGVRDKVTSLYSTVKAIPGKIKGFFTSLPETLKTIGKNIIQGLVNGIKGSLGAVVGAAQSIIDKIPGPIKKALGIHSPSRVMAEIGKWVTAGLVKGMLGGSKSVQAASVKLQGYITKAFKAGYISKGKADSLHAYVSKQNTKLLSLAKSREAIASDIASANAKLAGLKTAKSELAVSIADKARDFGSFMGALDSSEYGDNSASAVLSRLRGKLSGIIGFRQNLAALASRGLGRGIINEIAQAGPEEGGQMAEALLSAGVGEISQLNSTFASLGSESSKLGTFAASNYYDAGIAATEGLIKGLQSKQSSLTTAITKMAESMVKTLKKKLGIKSPSRVFRAQGAFTGEGFALGVEDQQGAVQDAVNALAGTRPTGRLANSSLAREAAVVAATSSAASPTVHVTVQGNVTAEKALAKSIAGTIRDEIVRQGKRNGGRTGL